METKMHMKEWLVAQIESGRFEGLCWEDEDRTMFRIPWKHAAKKDYKLTEDAALFKAWAVYKGKYREGRDKADPTMWKTRLRCALNKSTDFQEVPERNQLDITEPYKVYLIQHDTGPPRPAETSKIKDPVISQTKRSPRSPAVLDKQYELGPPKPRTSRVRDQNVSTARPDPDQISLHCRKGSFLGSEEEVRPLTDDLMREHTYCELTGKRSLKQSPAAVTFLSPSLTVSDFRMQVTLLYHGQMVMKVTTRSPDGCFILQGHIPVGNEQIYGPCTAQQLSFPSPGSMTLPTWMAEAMNRLLCHLERGVLLWVAPDGVYIKRFCQGRVYWSGPRAQHADRPNKLEREKTFKLLDVPAFLSELQSCLQGKSSTPSYEIDLCFGEEYPDPNVPKSRKLIMVKVVPLFAVELLQKYNVGEGEDRRRSSTSNTDSGTV